MSSKETKLSKEKRRELLRFNLENIREYIAIADSKANITLSLLSFIVGIGLGVSLIADTFENGILLTYTNYWYLFLIIPFYILLMAYLILSILGINSVIGVYRARLELKEEQEKEQELTGDIYFKHISDYQSSDEYHKGIMNKTEESYEKDLAEQVYSVSNVLSKKMAKVNESIKYLKISLILFILLLLLSAVIGILIQNGG